MDFHRWNILHVPMRCRIDADDLILNRHRVILSLFQDLHQYLAVIQTRLGILIDIRTKLRESRELPILRQL